MGACFAAIGHLFSTRLSSLSINSCHDIPLIKPYSSHPLLNPNYSSSDLKIRHEGITLSRFAKTRLVADWDFALKYLRVCNRVEHYKPGMLNCGKCEKCVRTMVAFLALGKLEKATCFPSTEVTEELISSAVELKYVSFPYWKELLPPLAEKGRHDLINAIERRMSLYQKAQKRKDRRERIKQLDQKYLNSTLLRIKRSFSRKDQSLATQVR
jgi:hypothetical protein